LLASISNTIRNACPDMNLPGYESDSSLYIYYPFPLFIYMPFLPTLFSLLPAPLTPITHIRMSILANLSILRPRALRQMFLTKLWKLLLLCASIGRSVRDPKIPTQWGTKKTVKKLQNPSSSQKLTFQTMRTASRQKLYQSADSRR
jgi:hypothetical protein